MISITIKSKAPERHQSYRRFSVRSFFHLVPFKACIFGDKLSDIGFVIHHQNFIQCAPLLSAIWPVSLYEVSITEKCVHSITNFFQKFTFPHFPLLFSQRHIRFFLSSAFCMEHSRTKKAARPNRFQASGRPVDGLDYFFVFSAKELFTNSEKGAVFSSSPASCITVCSFWKDSSFISGSARQASISL